MSVIFAHTNPMIPMNFPFSGKFIAHTTDKETAQQSQQRGGSHPPWSQDPSSWLLWMPKCTFHVYDSNSRNQDCKPWMNSWHITKARSNIQGYSLISPKSQHIMTTWYLNIYFQSTEFVLRLRLLYRRRLGLYERCPVADNGKDYDSV